MKKNIRDTVKEAILPTVEALGYRLWDVTYTKIGADYHLEITIDSDTGVGIEDCERVHRAIDPVLDECDPIEGFYYLEVSSPGVERELRCEDHILASLGARVQAALFAPRNGSKTIRGTLTGYENETITLTDPTGEITLPLAAIAKLSTVYFD